MGFGSYRQRIWIEKALHDVLPGRVTSGWVGRVAGPARWKHDLDALTNGLSRPVWNFLQRGGKRWRPVLMLLCCEAVGGNPKAILPFTAIPEVLHNATLIIDDIEDSSELRRGKPALHRIFGVDVAINAGNALFFLPFSIICNSGLPVEMKAEAYGIISRQAIKCHLGQTTDIWWHRGKAGRVPTWQEYFQMCANKTGSVAAMAAMLGALIGGGTERQIGALGRFAETAGVAFQVQDDILNIEGGIGKGFGDDIKEGKRSLPAIHALNTAHAEEKKRLLEILDMHTNDEMLIREAIAIIRKNGGVEYAGKAAAGLMEKAWENVEPVLPESKTKQKLKEFAQPLVGRSA